MKRRLCEDHREELRALEEECLSQEMFCVYADMIQEDCDEECVEDR